MKRVGPENSGAQYGQKVSRRPVAVERSRIFPCTRAISRARPGQNGPFQAKPILTLKRNYDLDRSARLNGSVRRVTGRRLWWFLTKLMFDKFNDRRQQ